MMTRAFGWHLPYTMLVPFADNLNHFSIEIYFELFNKKLTRQILKDERNFNGHEREYFTQNKMSLNFIKHFEEDDEELKKEASR